MLPRNQVDFALHIFDCVYAIIVYHPLSVNVEHTPVVGCGLETVEAVCGDGDLTSPAEHVIIHQIERWNLLDELVIVLEPDSVAGLDSSRDRCPAHPLIRVHGGLCGRERSVVKLLALSRSVGLKKETG